MGAIRVDHIDQTEESDAAFLTRLAGNYDAVAKPADGKLIFTKRHGDTLPSGKPIPTFALAPKDFTTWKARISERGNFSAVTTYYQDHSKGERIAVMAGAPSDGDDNDLGTFESLVGDMVAANTPAGWPGITAGNGGSNSNGEVPNMATIETSAITADYIAANHPDIAKHFRAEGTAQGTKDGAKAENDRIAKIDALALPGCDEVIAKAKADPSMTPEAFAMAQTEHLKAKKGDALKAFQGDDLGAAAPAATAGTRAGEPSDADKIKALVDSVAKA